MRLKAAGLVWHPRPGDRFAVPQPELLGQVFTLSDMTIEVHQHPAGPVLGFNGTTEWALDSVQAADAVWLPAEHQLRELLGPAFRRLEARPAADGDGLAGGDEIPGGDPIPGGDELPGGDGVPGGGGGVADDHGIAADGRDFEVVTAGRDGSDRSFHAPVAEDAYGRALLDLIQRATD